MKKYIQALLYTFFVTITSTAFTYKECGTYSRKSYSRSYVKKSPYAGLGKRSSVNGRIKIKSTRGYFKPSCGYKYVNPYARSK